MQMSQQFTHVIVANPKFWISISLQNLIGEKTHERHNVNMRDMSVIGG